MFEATRGGTRGGAAEFKWSDVKADKDRENYLGHSINAPQGRWQNKKDIHWYNRNKSDVTDEEAVRRQKARELKEIKMREENELSIALGYGPVHDPDKIGMEDDDEDQPQRPAGDTKTEREMELEKLEAEEKRRRKELKREKKAMKEMEKKIKKQEKEERKLESKSHRSRDHRHRSRERSPDRRDRSWSRERSRSPNHERRHGERRRASAYDPSPRRDVDSTPRTGRGEHEADRAQLRSRYGDHDRQRRRSPSPGKQRNTDAAESSRDIPGRRTSSSRNNDRKGGDYDFEAERARDRQRWERYHDRERGLADGDDWGKRSEGRPRDGGW